MPAVQRGKSSTCGITNDAQKQPMLTRLPESPIVREAMDLVRPS